MVEPIALAKLLVPMGRPTIFALGDDGDEPPRNGVEIEGNQAIRYGREARFGGRLAEALCGFIEGRDAAGPHVHVMPALGVFGDEGLDVHGKTP